MNVNQLINKLQELTPTQRKMQVALRNENDDGTHPVVRAQVGSILYRGNNVKEVFIIEG